MKTTDCLIIGAGPAGLQMAYYLEKEKKNYLVLESNSVPGSFFQKFPRHRTLISINKPNTGYNDYDLNLRWDWNSLLSDNEKLLFTQYTGKYFPDADDIVKYLADYATQNNLKIEFNATVVKVSKINNKFVLTIQNGETYECNKLIIATGVSKSYIPPIPGIEYAEKYESFNIDPNQFKNKRVLIIGKGNSAFETANSLVETTSNIHLTSPTPMTFAWTTHFPGHIRAVNNNIVDTYQLKSQNSILADEIVRIEYNNGFYYVTVIYDGNKQEDVLIYDRVIACTGFRFDDSIFDETCKPQLTINQRFPAQTHEWESTNIPDLYFIGTLSQARDYKKTASGFIHGFRYNVEALHKILNAKYYNQPLNGLSIECDPELLTYAMIERINQSSSIWQQFGFMCDVVIISEDNKIATYYESLPVDYVHNSILGKNSHYYTITLNYTTLEKNLPLSEQGEDFVINPDQNPRQFLHPIIRRFSGSKVVAEHHIAEDLWAEWWDLNLYVAPLLKFLQNQLITAQNNVQNKNENTLVPVVGWYSFHKNKLAHHRPEKSLTDDPNNNNKTFTPGAGGTHG